MPSSSFSSGFPGREFSHLILQGSWPSSESDDRRIAASNNGQGARDVRSAAADTHRSGEQFLQVAGGRFADATYRGYLSDEALQLTFAEFLEAAEKVNLAIADDIDMAKAHLEHIDWQAHEEIAKIREAGGPLAKALEIGVIAAARTSAMTYADAKAAEIVARKKDLPGLPAKDEHQLPGSAFPGKKFQQGPWSPGGNGDHVFPASNGKRDDLPSSRGSDNIGSENGAADGGQGSDPKDRARPGDGKPDSNQDQSGHTPNQNGDNKQLPGVRGDSNAASIGGGSDSSPGSRGGASSGTSPLGGGSLPSPGGGSGGSPGGGSGMFGGSSGLSSAFQSGRGVPSGGGPGLGGTGAGAPGGVGGLRPGVGGPGAGAPGGGGAPANPAGEFARNFSTAAMSSPSVPPMASAAPAQPPAAASSPVSPVSSAGAAPASAAPPAASAGVASPAVSPLAGAMPSGGMTPGPAAASAGPAPAGGAGLAPVGSDAVRHVGGVSAPSTGPAGGPTPAGVTASGTSGAAGGAATASMTAGLDPGSGRRRSARQHETVPDPHLSAAIQLVFELMYGSRMFDGAAEWCVGVFRTPTGAMETIVTSNEGAGYIPGGVFLPRSARMLFSDSLVDNGFREEWFGRSNPVETMVAYAQLRRGEDGRLPLYAVAASALMPGAAILAPAEEAGVEHVHLCYLDESPLRPGTHGDQVLDAAHVHRLDVVDPVLMRWMEAPERTVGELVARCGRLTTVAFETVSARLGMSGLMIPDAAVGVFNWLEYSGGDISEVMWADLDATIKESVASAAAFRPIDDTASSVEHYRRRHDIARLAELLYWWRPMGEDQSILFLELAYSARQIVDSE